MEPILLGSGVNVDVVVRHYLAGGGSMIRKTMRGNPPREVLVYQSGLIDCGGRWWRAPQVYGLEAEGEATWHLFMEDLGDVGRRLAAPLIIDAARALGEMNATHSRDRSLTDRFPWLPVDAHAGGGRPIVSSDRGAIDRLTAVVGRAARQRAQRTLATLSDDQAIAERVAALPVVFCHGNPSPTNVAARHGVTVLLDWGLCQLAPVGSDLGDLLGVNNPIVLKEPEIVEGSVEAYVEGAADGGLDVSIRDVELGYRQRRIQHGLKRVVTASARRDVDDPPGERRRLEAILGRLCDEADTLLARFGHGHPRPPSA